MTHDAPAPGQRWRAVESGNLYRVLHVGQMKAQRKKNAPMRPWEPSVTFTRLREDGTETGEVYTRHRDEFCDKYRRED